MEAANPQELAKTLESTVMERKSDCIHEQVVKADCKCPLYNRL